MGVEKKSIIDFYVVCESVLPLVKSMKIDNGKQHTLTNYQKGSLGVNSDHKLFVMEVQLEVQPHKKEKVEILDFKDTSSQIKFRDITSKTEEFTKCIESVGNVSEQATNWLKLVKMHLRRYR